MCEPQDELHDWWRESMCKPPVTLCMTVWTRCPSDMMNLLRGVFWGFLECPTVNSNALLWVGTANPNA